MYAIKTLLLDAKKRRRTLHRANISMETRGGDLVDRDGTAEEQSGRYKITGQLDKEIV
jgi:hypothetical protein